MHSGALAHALDRLTHTGRVLYVGAHPDDENSCLLAYLANARHVTVAYLSLTRGEGGQNLIGTEQGDLLGVLRTQELLAARRIDGALQCFAGLRDFGYSKSADETLAAWGHAKALAAVVWTVRTFQPDVVIARFDEHTPDHGHHTASAILAREAFVAAADPQRFPEQLHGGVQPWQAARLLQNVFPGREKPADALQLDVGGYDARLGLSYGELAALAHSQHKCQGVSVPGERGPRLEWFVPLVGTRPEKDILEGFDGGWERFGARAAMLVLALEGARATLERDTPERALPSLLEAHRALESLPDEPRTRDVSAALDTFIASAAGLFLRATAETPVAPPGITIPVRVEVVLRRPAAVTLDRLVFPGTGAVAVHAPLRLNERQELSGMATTLVDADLSWPDWLRDTHQWHKQDRYEESLWGAAQGRAPLEVHAELGLGDRTIRMTVPVQYVWTDRVLGERARLVMSNPPATVTPERKAVLLPNGRTGRVTIRVRGWQEGLQGSVRLPAPQRWVVRPAQWEISLASTGDETVLYFEVQAPPGATAISLMPEVVIDGQSWSLREDVIDQPHVPVQRVLQPASLRLVPLSVRLPAGLVGYVAGSGDTVMADLAHIGVRVQQIDEETLRNGDLSRYAAIVLGIRAFNTRPVLRAVRHQMMSYVEQGGTLVVQYNTYDRWSQLDFDIGPYPLTIGRGRVTDESAEMLAVDPEQPVLKHPNPIGPDDFVGWVQERGLYFAHSWDERYQPVFRVADPGELPLLGGLLVARYGRGRYVYTGLAFFRQLPAGVPGAYRLFANLIGDGNSQCTTPDNR